MHRAMRLELVDIVHVGNYFRVLWDMELLAILAPALSLLR
jgi:hypothetical protein